MPRAGRAPPPPPGSCHQSQQEQEPETDLHRGQDVAHDLGHVGGEEPVGLDGPHRGIGVTHLQRTATRNTPPRARRARVPIHDSISALLTNYGRRWNNPSTVRRVPWSRAVRSAYSSARSAARRGHRIGGTSLIGCIEHAADERRADDHGVGEACDLRGLPTVGHAKADPDRHDRSACEPEQPARRLLAGLCSHARHAHDRRCVQEAARRRGGRGRDPTIRRARGHEKHPVELVRVARVESTAAPRPGSGPGVISPAPPAAASEDANRSTPKCSTGFQYVMTSTGTPVAAPPPRLSAARPRCVFLRCSAISLAR